MIKILLRILGFLVILIPNTEAQRNGPYLGSNLPCVDRSFSVVYHVLRDSLGGANISNLNLESAINQCNQLFEPICISFNICEINYYPNYKFDTLGIERERDELEAKFHQKRKINIFVVGKLGEESDFAFFDWGLSTKDGINMFSEGSIVLEKADITRILPHEMGHFFGLYDTYERSAFGAELNNGSNCSTAGDRICDTPADPFRESASIEFYLQDCQFVEGLNQTDDNGEEYAPEICNVMSRYYTPECPFFISFSHEQLKTMANNYLNGPKLMW